MPTLIVTVVILIILAGVSINIAIKDNGIINKSKETVDEYKSFVEIQQGYIDKKSEELALGADSTEYKSKHPEDRIPTGFTHLEGTVDTGYVIQDEQENEFVWIPVPYPVASSEAELTSMVAKEQYPMAVKTSGKDANGLDNYRGALYDFDINQAGTAVTVTPRSYNPNSGYREPANLIGRATIDEVEYVFDSQEMFTKQNAGTWYETMYQEEYNELVASVIKNGGFWIGRYESGNLSSTAVSKVGASGISNVNWYQMYKSQKNIYGSSSSNKTHMIWGSQWDQIMIWMKDVSSYDENSFYILNSTNMGVYSNNQEENWKKNSGRFKIKEVYDLGGNVRDWTMEVSSQSRVFRGRVL